jgi:hypothetical protein
MSEYRVEKERAEATLTLSNGVSVRGYLFVGAGVTYAGRERIKDLLNGESGFLPFEITDEEPSRTVLYHRDHIVIVTLAGVDEPRQDPGYEMATKRSIAMQLTDGTRLSGDVRVYFPRGRDRLSDYARTPEPFRYLEGRGVTYVVNTRHILELTETTDL